MMSGQKVLFYFFIVEIIDMKEVLFNSLFAEIIDMKEVLFYSLFARNNRHERIFILFFICRNNRHEASAEGVPDGALHHPHPGLLQGQGHPSAVQ